MIRQEHSYEKAVVIDDAQREQMINRVISCLKAQRDEYFRKNPHITVLDRGFNENYGTGDTLIVGVMHTTGNINISVTKMITNILFYDVP